MAFLGIKLDSSVARQFRDIDVPGERSPENEMSFLEVVFSLLFGDGNPNRNIQQKRTLAIASLIRHNSGVIIAEQAKPYLDDCLLGRNSSDRHEGFILSILKLFDGRAESTDDGQLVYIFSHMKTSKIRIFSPDLNLNHTSTNEVIPPPVYENTWNFSKAQTSQLLLAYGLGVLNVILLFVFKRLLEGLDITNFWFIQWVVFCFNPLLIYGALFILIPVARFFTIQVLNTLIDNRNHKRRTNAVVFMQQLLLPEHRDKLLFAKTLQSRMEITEKDIVFTTSSNYPELELKDYLAHLDDS